MQSPLAKPVPIKLDRDRSLLFDFNALVSLEDALGEGVLAADFWKRLEAKDIRAKDVRALLWASLLHEDPSLTLEAAGRLINNKTIGVITEALGRAASESMPDAEEAKDEGSPLAVTAPV